MPTWAIRRLPELGVSPSHRPLAVRPALSLVSGRGFHASRRVAQLEGVIRKARKGREVLISLH